MIIYLTHDFAIRLTTELRHLNNLKEALLQFNKQTAVLKDDYLDTLHDLEGCLQACATSTFIRTNRIDRHNCCWSLIQLIQKLEYVQNHIQFDNEIIDHIIQEDK